MATAKPRSAPGGLRERISASSRPALLWISRLPPLAVPGAVLALMVTGLAAPLPFALPALGVAATFVGWLAYLSWPALSLQGRAVRGVMVSLVLGAAVARIRGWL